MVQPGYKVRFCKASKDRHAGKPVWEDVTVTIALHGPLGEDQADNPVSLPSDTMRQTTYILAKQNPVTPIERFGAVLANHFATAHSQVHVARVTIVQKAWDAIGADYQPPPHAFCRDDSDFREAAITATKGGHIKVQSSIKGYRVLKSLGLSFHLPDPEALPRPKETDDWFVRTNIGCDLWWKDFSSIEQVKSESAKFHAAKIVVRGVLRETFAKDNVPWANFTEGYSPELRNMTKKMGEKILRVMPDVDEVLCTMQGKRFLGRAKVWEESVDDTAEDTEVYIALRDPPRSVRSFARRGL